MIINLFNIFDPARSITYSWNWVSLFIFIILLPFQYWLIPSRYTIFWSLIFKFIHKEFKSLLNYSYSNVILFIRVFIIIIINNLLGLFPYVFTASTHIRFCIAISTSLWISIILTRLINYFNDLISHLTPQGTPFPLIPFIVLIESISLFIRPLTLAIRLTANIIAGHLLLCLLGTASISIHRVIIFIIIISVQLALFILELSVTLIQAYVFATLSVLYRREV